MTDTPELKPCPFCGGDAFASDGFWFEGDWEWPSVSCLDRKCGCKKQAVRHPWTLADAIAAWNTRASPVDANKPTPTAVDDSAAANTVVNGGLVEAVARAICSAGDDDPDAFCAWPSTDAKWTACIHEARTAIATAAPLIRAQRDAEIAAWLREHAPQWGHEALADAIERGEVG